MQSDMGIITSTEIIEQVLNQFPGSSIRKVVPPEGLLTGGVKSPKVIAAEVDTVELSLNILNTYSENEPEAGKTLSEVQKWVLFRDSVRQNHKVIWSKLDPLQPWSEYYVSGTSASGYPVKLVGKGWELLTGRIAVVGGKPNTRIQIHSEILWLYGYETIACGIITALKERGLVLDQVRISRLDLMGDVCAEKGKVSEEWGKRINGSARVVRSFWSESDGEYTGFETATGPIKLRVYDKFDEIRQNAKKNFDYVFDQWGIREEPEDMRVFRVEFELRRAFLRSWGINEPQDFVGKEAALWGYLTCEWARVNEKAVGAGRRQREKVDEVWQAVQSAYGERGLLSRIKREKIGKKHGYLWEDPSLRPLLRGLQHYIGYDNFMSGKDPDEEIDTDLLMQKIYLDLMIYCGGYKEFKEELKEGQRDYYEECLKKGYCR